MGERDSKGRVRSRGCEEGTQNTWLPPQALLILLGSLSKEVRRPRFRLGTSSKGAGASYHETGLFASAGASDLLSAELIRLRQARRREIPHMGLAVEASTARLAQG